MTIPEFIAKWRQVELKERSAAQEHFIDLCNLFEHPTPAAADPTGENFCFEKGAAKHAGGDGFADVWKRGCFGFEYKGKHKDLAAAYDQLLRYRNALENPPLLVVCDLDRIIVHTNFTGTVSATHEIALESLGEARNVAVLRAVFHDPATLHPVRTSEAVTQDAARHFAEIAAAMRNRGLDPTAVAHFLDRIVFCLFAEDTRLLPEMVISRIAKSSRSDPARFGRVLGQLFDIMATGGDFGLEPIRHFNGNLFEDRSVLDLTADEMRRIAAAADLDWSAVDPSIFGTLFERGLDPAKRSQLGAHFTGREDIELVVDAVIMTVLRREWDECRAIIDNLLATGSKTPTAAAPAKPMNAAAMKKARGESGSILHRFLDRLQRVQILDPACGSGNFLYVALLRLKDLEKEAILYGNDNGLGSFLPMVGPWQLHGMEINSYAHDLAQMTVWIGWLQWIRSNGFGFPADPILRPLSENIRLMDAIVSDNGEPEWPAVDFIIGNPPFLGGKMLRREMGGEYIDRIFANWRGRVPPEADLCCYWFEKSRAHIAAGKCQRAGLLATQAIRGGANREVLKRIKESGGIFWAESDRQWILAGANVHVSMVGFDNGREKTHILDGKAVETINSNLSASAADITQAREVAGNHNIAFMGTTKGGSFDIDEALATSFLHSPNPHGRPNSDIVVPWVNGMDLTQRGRGKWIIDFGVGMTIADAAKYEASFEYIRAKVKPERDKNARESYRRQWWQHVEARPAMRACLMPLARFLCTCRVSKHRLFVWLNIPTLPDSATFAFVRADDYFFGVLHSRIHEVWSLAQGTQLREKESGFRYTPTTCFETFPFPFANDTAGEDPLHFVASLRAAHYHFGQDDVVQEEPLPPSPNEHRAAIAAAAKSLNELRENWLNPPEWTREEIMEFPGTLGGPWDRFIDPATVTERGAFKVGTVRYARLVARDAACAARLKERTLTKLYNVRPAWLAACHAQLDAAVATAYGWPADLTDEAILENLLALNQAAAS